MRGHSRTTIRASVLAGTACTVAHSGSLSPIPVQNQSEERASKNKVIVITRHHKNPLNPRVLYTTPKNVYMQVPYKTPVITQSSGLPLRPTSSPSTGADLPSAQSLISELQLLLIGCIGIIRVEGIVTLCVGVWGSSDGGWSVDVEFRVGFRRPDVQCRTLGMGAKGLTFTV